MGRLEVPGGGRVAWEETGSGHPAVVLLHGWCCDRGFLAPQRDHFAAAHRVIAIDLPGHGESDAPVRDYSIPALAADVAWLCERWALEGPILVGHSLGGAIAVDVAVARPEGVGGAVVLDTTVGPTIETRRSWDELVAALGTADFRAAARDTVARLYFLPTDDAARRERILAVMTAAPQHVMRDGMAGIAAWDSERAVAAVRVPLLHVARSAGGTDHERLRELCPHALTGRVVGSGHFVTLEVPGQVNAMIDRFLELNSPA